MRLTEYRASRPPLPESGQRFTFDTDGVKGFAVRCTPGDRLFDASPLLPFIEALQRSPRLVEEYNAFKSHHDGANMALYRKAKDAFVETVLADFISNP